MNKHYDKLILLVAVCALIVGGVLYVKQSGPAGGRGKPLGSGSYAAVAVPTMEINEVDWIKPGIQPSGFKYDVFTPFEIYIDPNTGEFTQEAVDIEPPVEDIDDAILLSITRKPYRIQLEGYIDEGEGKVLFLLYDVELKKNVRARNGEDSAAAAASDFKVIAAEVKRVADEAGGLTRVATATILDERTGEQKTLIHRELLFEDDVSITVGSNEDSSFQAELKKVGETFKTPHGRYTLQEINLEDSTITVEKAATTEFDSVIRTLDLQAPETEEPTTTEDEIIDPSIAPDTAFDLFFQ
ncbi:MAG: hypothetical protein ACPGJU_03115 [Coraliomargarita sp.]